MANKTVIKISLSKDSIDDARKQIRQYREKLDARLKVLMDKLGEIGVNTIQTVMSSVPENDEPGNYSVKYSTDGENCTYRTMINLTGDKVLFIEFSAGITYGTTKHPLDIEGQYGMGTYPSEKGHWSDPLGWWYKDEDGDSIHTYGNRAYMPMYHADEEIISRVQQVAKNVFSNM